MKDLLIDSIKLKKVGAIYISNKKTLDKKINQFQKSRNSSIQVIADFDRTLTKSFLDDGTPHTTWFLVIKNKYTLDFNSRMKIKL